jgi:hypothetical protein
VTYAPEWRLQPIDAMSKRVASFRVSDTTLAVLTTVLGLAAVAHSVVTQREPFAMLPGMDGALTAGLLGFAFAMLHGLRYGDVLRALVPVLGIQIGGCLVHGESVVAIVGLEFLVVGLVGMVLVYGLQSRQRDDASSPDERRRALTSPSGLSTHLAGH